MKNNEENMAFESKCEEDYYYWIWIFGPDIWEFYFRIFWGTVHFEFDPCFFTNN